MACAKATALLCMTVRQMKRSKCRMPDGRERKQLICTLQISEALGPELEKRCSSDCPITFSGGRIVQPEKVVGSRFRRKKNSRQRTSQDKFYRRKGTKNQQGNSI